MKNKSPKKLKIAIICPPTLPIPPFNGYGGTQRGVYDFLTHMNKKGHELHLIAPNDSKVSHLENVVLHSCVDKSLWIPENKAPIEKKLSQLDEYEKYSIDKLKEISKKSEIDIINLREDNIPILKKLSKIFGKDKIVYGLHNLKSKEKIEVIKKLDIQCVAHCNSHREQYEELPNINVITYGINFRHYPFSSKTLTKTNEVPEHKVLRHLKEKNKDYLITLGGIGENKGQKTSIRLAKETENILIIAGTAQRRLSDKNYIYFENQIKPHINNKDIFHVGELGEEEKKPFLKYAKGFLFPSGFEDTTWNEPFGRAPVEALSCGTPVIAYRSGSMSEIIYDKFNGFIFDDFEQAKRCINSLDKISRGDCRKTIKKKFDSHRVAEECEELFYRIKDNKNLSSTL